MFRWSPKKKQQLLEFDKSHMFEMVPKKTQQLVEFDKSHMIEMVPKAEATVGRVLSNFVSH